MHYFYHNVTPDVTFCLKEFAFEPSPTDLSWEIETFRDRVCSSDFASANEYPTEKLFLHFRSSTERSECSGQDWTGVWDAPFLSLVLEEVRPKDEFHLDLQCWESGEKGRVEFWEDLESRRLPDSSMTFQSRTCVPTPVADEVVNVWGS